MRFFLDSLFTDLVVHGIVAVFVSKHKKMRYIITCFGAGLNRVWQRYLYHLDRHPFTTQALNTGFLMAAGDAIAQLLSKDCEHDFRRTARFAVVGLAIAGPVMTVWYRALDRTIVGTKGSMAVRKTLLDQVFFLPVYLVGFVWIMGVLRRDPTNDIVEKLKRDLWSMLVASYSVWPAVQLANFYVLPLRHRVLAINFVCLFWNAYVAWKAEETLPSAI